MDGRISPNTQLWTGDECSKAHTFAKIPCVWCWLGFVIY